jgi:hypothetical protein
MDAEKKEKAGGRNRGIRGVRGKGGGRRAEVKSEPQVVSYRVQANVVSYDRG